MQFALFCESCHLIHCPTSDTTKILFPIYDFLKQSLFLLLLNSRKCVTPAHPRPPLEPIPTCMPYKYGEEGVCSSVIGDRLIYGSLQTQDSMERLLMNFTRARAYALFKDDISERCLKTVEVIYCNHYFQRCDNAFSTILPVPVCREACDVMVQQHCKEEYRRAYEINKAVQGSKATSRQLQWAFDLINCTALPGRNGGTIPECYYPRELEGT